MNKRKKAIFQELTKYEDVLKKIRCRDNYMEYVEKVHHGRWVRGKHLVYVCEKIQLLIEDKLYNEFGNKVSILVVSIPPQSGKSMTITETLPSWYLGKHPNKRVIVGGYNTDFARKFGRRNIAKIKEFGYDIFNIKLSKETDEEIEIEGNIGAALFRGIMSGITGNPGDLIILDDPIKNMEEADSDAYKDRLWSEYLASIKTRVQANTKIILIQTRWSECDLAGMILAEEKEKCLEINFPIEAEENDILGREVGEALFPEIGKDTAWVKDFKKSYISKEGSRVWTCLFMGKPSAVEGNMIKRDWFRYYDRIPEKFDRIAGSWDCTFKKTDTSDYVVGQVWGMIGIDCYLLDMVRARMDLVDTINSIEDMKRKWPEMRRIFVEDKANGSAVIQILQKKISGIIPVNPKGGKMARVSAISPHIESGHIFLPKHMDFTSQFLAECCSFPNGQHDDICFIAGTKISTIFGYKNIEDIKIGDRVITPFGIGKVTNAGCTGEFEVIKRHGLIGTKNHPIFTNELGFVKMDSLSQSMNCSKLNLRSLITWKYKKLLILMESNIDLWERENIILVNQKTIMEEKILKDFMLQFGNFIITKQFQKAMLFIIKMAILLITILITWNVYHIRNILGSIQQKIKKNSLNIWKKLDGWLKNGIGAKKVWNGTVTIMRDLLVKLKKKSGNVNFAKRNLCLDTISQGSALITVIQNGDIEMLQKTLKKSVSYVKKYLKQGLTINTKMENQLVEEYALESLTGSIEKQKVYNITVDKYHVYYANDILVSNCDSFSQAINQLMYYAKLERGGLNYNEGGIYARGELKMLGLSDSQINMLVRQGKVQLIGR